MITIINETNITESKSNAECILNKRDITIQNELVADGANNISIKYYGTVHMDADDNSESLWVDITDLLFGSSTITVSNETKRNYAILNGNAFCKIKVSVTNVTIAANNTINISVGY